MSTSSLWVMDAELKGSESNEYRNSWWFSPIVWDVLLDKYMHDEIQTPYGMKKNFISHGDSLQIPLNKKINACESFPDRVCWELSNQQVFFSKDKELIAQAIKDFCSSNTAYNIHSEDKVSVLTFDHIIERFNEIANDILSIDEKDHPYFVFKNTSVDGGVEYWFEYYDDETEDFSQRSLSELDKYVTEFVTIDGGVITGFTNNLDFSKLKRESEMKKLSELKDDVELSYDNGEILTAAELRSNIEAGNEHVKAQTWHIIERKRWQPSAQSMINEYIESEAHGMYHDWDESATDCITPDHVAAIQAVLDKAFEGDFATEYWTLAEEIKIDVSPKSKGESK